MLRTISRLALCLVVFFVCGSALLAAPDNTHALNLNQLKAQLLKLRNTDLNLSKRDLWEQTAARLEAWTLRTENKDEQADALFHSALAYEEIAKRAVDASSARLAVSLFERFCTQFAADRRCPDSLVRAADLSANTLADKARAQGFYTAVLQRFPGSEAAIVARAKLQQVVPQGSQVSAATKQSPKPTAIPIDASTDRLPIVVIDPGHGGDDLGASGVGGLLEKDVVLAIALEVRDRAVEQGSFKVVLTRDSDRFIPLAQRTSIANSADGKLFISIHANASPNHTLSGIESYYLDNTDDYAAKRLAEIENSAGATAAAGDLEFILSDMVQGAKVPQSTQLAQVIQKQVIKQIEDSGWSAMRDYGVKKAPFFVLVGARMPCTLIEVAYIDHPDDGKNLATPEFRSALAHGILNGIEQYLSIQTKAK